MILFIPHGLKTCLNITCHNFSGDFHASFVLIMNNVFRDTLEISPPSSPSWTSHKVSKVKQLRWPTRKINLKAWIPKRSISHLCWERISRVMQAKGCWEIQEQTELEKDIRCQIRLTGFLYKYEFSNYPWSFFLSFFLAGNFLWVSKALSFHSQLKGCSFFRIRNGYGTKDPCPLAQSRPFRN